MTLGDVVGKGIPHRGRERELNSVVVMALTPLWAKEVKAYVWGNLGIAEFFDMEPITT